MVGLVAFTGLLAGGLLTLWRAYGHLRRAGREPEAVMALGLWGGLVAAMANGLLDVVTPPYFCGRPWALPIQ